jgi:hypothetical protein
MTIDRSGPRSRWRSLAIFQMQSEYRRSAAANDQEIDDPSECWAEIEALYEYAELPSAMPDEELPNDG